MAKKSSSRSRSSDGPPSNTGLIVTMIFFILATIGLGVTTYMGYGGKSDAVKEAATAASKQKEAEKKAEEADAKRVAVKIAAGAADAGDKARFGSLKGTHAPAIATELAAFYKEFLAQLTLDNAAFPEWKAGAADQPAKSLKQFVVEMQEDKGKAVAASGEADRAKKSADTDHARQVEELRANLKTANDNLAKRDAEVLAVRNDKYGESDQKSAEIKRLSEENKRLEQALNETMTDKDRQIAKLKTEMATSRKVRQQLAEKIGPLLEKLDQVQQARPELRDLAELRDLMVAALEGNQSIVNDTPKGMIVETRNGQVYINLGSADNVRPGLTFSVMPAGSTGKGAAGKTRKGAIEIVAVLEAHLSAAKIVEANNQARDPLLRNDLLFNPAWDPTQKVHVAIAGIVDLNGSGVDGTQDLVRQLERQNIVVDAWLDLRDRTIKGPGMTERTTYLIKGERPVLPPNMPPDANPLAIAITEVIGRMTEMEAKSRELGVPSVQYRRFLSLIGYKLPRAVQPGEFNASSYLHGSNATKSPDKNKEDTGK
jgi:hypothetical protein